MSRRGWQITAGTASLAVLAAALAGCGSSNQHGSDTTGSMMGRPGMMSGSHRRMPGYPPTTPPATTPPNAKTTGQALFLASGCGGCHTLAAAGTNGTVGPNLDHAHPSYQLALDRITYGGTGMPSFNDSLTAAQIRALARYVADSTR
jgi:mono/diheme cytochrome c family protein